MSSFRSFVSEAVEDSSNKPMPKNTSTIVLYPRFSSFIPLVKVEGIVFK